MTKSFDQFTGQSPKQQQGSIIGFILLIIIVAAMILLGLYAFYLNNTIINKFENRRWDIPATVYSRPLELYPNAPVKAGDLESWLKLLNYSQGKNTQGSYQKSGNTYTIYTRGFNYGDGDVEPKQTIKVLFSDGKIARLQTSQPTQRTALRLEPVNVGGIYPENNEDRILLTKDNVPKHLVNALIATEDRNFYEHHGVSVRGTARALLSNVTGGTRQGGSTITQQLIKNFYLNSDRTLKRKANEALMALLLELHYDKDEILLAYLNEISLGQNGNRSVNGFGIASQFYFNKPLAELRLDQYALLVGIAKGSSYYNPRKHPERAKDRRNTVLHNMFITGKISQEEYDSATQKPLDVVKTPTIAKSRFPDFFDAIQRELKAYYREEDLQNRGLRIISTLDPLAQRAADNAIKNNKKSNLQGALISANPATGEVVAIVGSSADFTGFNRAIDAKRQVGSLLKPIIYLTALQSGRYNLASSVDDSPLTYTIGNQTWTPKNYSGVSHGATPLTTALAQSYNQAAVNVGMEFGLPIFYRQLQMLGVSDQIPNYPSVLLGAVDMSPMQVLSIYQTFANSGVSAPIHTIKSVIDDKGKVLQNSDSRAQIRLSPKATYLTNYAMQKVFTHGTARAGNFNSSLNLAGKTGTTNDGRDAWFAGYSGNYVSVVWIGRDDNKPIGLTGSSGALPIWRAFMQPLNHTPVELPLPADIEWTWLDNGTGLLSHQGCQGAIWAPVIREFMPQEYGSCAENIRYNVTLQERIDALGDELVSMEEDYVEDDYIIEEPMPSDEEFYTPNNEESPTPEPFYQ
ncbi:penicillin-binding protein [Moraxella bovoculi]|uniref:Penicillin-binding protein 1B n=1 Tax=Moraxella bovoculi TaxID=386891 RepID=A0AAC8PYA5_9GAMM|nr:penicillin-binding protein 1B [Moraxella bovoculi]AKG08114.1 penicillin-binding protein [Moraxella bovoculi]AKG11164.1 penicillin-binding protein [Moraxella bovoculi]AKG13156.1 penicillin-binding protein [Moraxella bovoculi]